MAPKALRNTVNGVKIKTPTWMLKPWRSGAKWWRVCWIYGWGASAADTGLSLTPCSGVAVSKPSTEALGGRGEGGTVTRELITENAIWTLCLFLAFVCLAFGCCLLSARRVNIQTPAVMSALNKGRSLLVCTGRPPWPCQTGAGGRVFFGAGGCPCATAESGRAHKLYDSDLRRIHDGNIPLTVAAAIVRVMGSFICGLMGEKIFKKSFGRLMWHFQLPLLDEWRVPHINQTSGWYAFH